ncbi:MAG: RDD family protein [Myxococcota bacterium]|nr:RDD family protein [Myxococcota bacterium]
MTTPSPDELGAPAELPQRALARAVDAALVTALVLALGAWIGFGLDWLALGAAVVIAYFVALDALAGATLGKCALGLRVIGPGGDRPSLAQHAVRVPHGGS